jgi:serine/threonine-protein kinase
LLVRPRNELHARPIDGSENASTPFFSPDGSSVGFLGENQIRIVSLAANKIVNVSDSLNGVAGASWGPDGFIYADGARESPLIRVRAAPGSPVAWFTALDTVNGEIDHTWPEVLPNGKGVLFTVTFSGKNKPGGRASVGIAVAEIPSGAHRIVVEGGVYPRYAEPGRLLYVTPSGLLMMVPFDQTTMTVTGPPTTLTTGMRVGRFGSADLAISAKGTLVYSSGAERFQQNLVWKSRNGSETPATPDWPPGVLADPALSPDGKSVAVSRSIDGRTAEIWIRDVSRGTSLKLTNGGVFNRAPTWTPDGL